MRLAVLMLILMNRQAIPALADIYFCRDVTDLVEVNQCTRHDLVLLGDVSPINGFIDKIPLGIT